MDKDIIYSIIIPHYNVPSLLSRCLKSIPNRPDVQVIVVDDLSPNRETYNDIIPELHRENVEFYIADQKKGGGHARNIGLQHAVGNYVIFSDSDDYFNYCIDEILDEYKDSDYDCVFFNATILDQDTYLPRKASLRPALYYEKYKDSPDVLEFYLRYYFGQPWCKMVKRELIKKHHIQFEETIIHNDTQYSYLIGYHAGKVKIDKRCIYSYMVRSGSVSKQEWNDDVLMTRLEVFAKKYAFLKNNGIDYNIEFHVPNVFMSYMQQNKRNQVDKCYAVVRKYGITDKDIKCALQKRKFEKSLIGKIFNRLTVRG